MTLVISVRFPLGRYHAAPWDRHVNEGIVEWPPSAWRLARALFCVWKARAAHLATDDVRAALDAISAPPTYWVPPVTDLTTRHYYPDAGHLGGGVGLSVDKIFDASVAIGPGQPVYLVWESSPPAAGAAVLDKLLGLLPYLGRAESICTAERVIHELTSAPPGHRELRPGGGSGMVLPSPRRPIDFDELTVTTDRMRRALLARPPGAIWTAYDTPDRRTASPARVATDDVRPTVVLLGLGGRVLPPVTVAAAVGHVAARAAVASFFGAGRSSSPTLSGHDASGHPLRDETQHQHAHYLPLPNRTGRIDRICVWAPAGLSAAEVASVANLTSLYPPHRRRQATAQPDKTTIPGFGRVRCLPAAVGDDEILAAVGLQRLAHRWCPVTPFATVRHEHRRRYGGEQVGPYSVGFIEDEINRELRHRQLPSASVSVSDRKRDPATRYWRRRSTDRLAKSLPAVWVELTFAEPVAGPIVLGALSHYGLGLFEPAD